MPITRRGLLKSSLKFAAAYACVRGGDYYWNKTSELQKASLSNDQYKLLKFLSMEFDTICLGDTNHIYSSLYYLLTDKAFLNNLAEMGIKKIFDESDMRTQSAFDKVKKGEASEKRFSDYCTKYLGDGWWPENKNRQYCERLASDLTGTPISFHPIDQRVGILSPLQEKIISIIDFGARIFLPHSWPNIFSVLPVIVVDRIFHKPEASVYKDIGDSSQFVTGALSQLSPDEKCMIALGAGHFDGDARNYSAVDMFDGLQAHGRKPVVINVYYSDGEYRFWKEHIEQVKIEQHKYLRKSDIEFFLENDQQPAKIVFNNKELEAKYLAVNFDPNRPPVTASPSLPAHTP